MFAHLREAHGIDAMTTPAFQRMAMHLDGREFFQNNYAITFPDHPDVQLARFVRSERAMDDLMRWA